MSDTNYYFIICTDFFANVMCVIPSFMLDLIMLWYLSAKVRALGIYSRIIVCYCKCAQTGPQLTLLPVVHCLCVAVDDDDESFKRGFT